MMANKSWFNYGFFMKQMSRAINLFWSPLWNPKEKKHQQKQRSWKIEEELRALMSWHIGYRTSITLTRGSDQDSANTFFTLALFCLSKNRKLPVSRYIWCNVVMLDCRLLSFYCGFCRIKFLLQNFAFTCTMCIILPDCLYACIVVCIVGGPSTNWAVYCVWR